MFYRIGQAVTVTESGAIGFIENIAVDAGCGTVVFFVNVINPAALKQSPLTPLFFNQIKPREAFATKAKFVTNWPDEHLHAALLISPDEVFLMSKSINISSFYDTEHAVFARCFFATNHGRQPNEIELQQEIISILRTWGIIGYLKLLPDYKDYHFVGTGV